jgi:hypothetical protein
VIDDLLRRMAELERRQVATAAELPPSNPVPAPRPAVEAPAPPTPPRAAESAVAGVTPPLAPGQFEVDEAAVATALQRALVQQGALLLPPGTVQVQPSLSYIRQEEDTSTFFTQGNRRVATAEQSEGRLDNIGAGLALLLGLPFDSQLSLSVPYQYQDTSTVTQVGSAEAREESGNASGFGDLSINFTKGLLRERGWRPDLFAGLTWDTDTGQTDSGVPLGSGFDEVTANITAVKSQDPLAFVGSLSYTYPFENNGSQPGDIVGLSFSTILAASPETSLRFSLDQNFIDNAEVDGRGEPGSDEVSSLLSIGVSSILTAQTFLDAQFGIGLTESAPDYTVNIAIPIRFNLPLLF